MWTDDIPCTDIKVPIVTYKTPHTKKRINIIARSDTKAGAPRGYPI